MTIDIHEFKDRSNSNPDFSSSSRFFDGIILIEIGVSAVWMKVFMGKIIAVSPAPFPFGYTFAVKGSEKGWRFALDRAKNRFREALYNGRLRIEGNTLEYNRIAKAVHGLTDVLREMMSEGRVMLEEEK